MWFVYAILGNVLWSVSDVAASIIMNRFRKSSVMVAWFFSVLQLGFLAILYILLPIEHVWIGVFALSALCSYVASLAFFQLLQRVDVSVSSVAWVFLSVGLAFGGVFLFHESWTVLQSIGALLSICGALALALWHKRIERTRTLVLICLSGLLYVPPFLVQKSAFLSGISVSTVFFWMLLFFDVCAFCFPFLLPRYRSDIPSFLTSLHPVFVGLVLLWVLVSMAGFFVVQMAYLLGSASLVGIFENGQPFFLLLFAWLATLITPKYAPREILTAQTTGVKIATFLVVFTGLALLAIS